MSRDLPGPLADLGTLGDFRLLREIGRGGMGVVYEAQQISLDRCVALKVLPFTAALDDRHLQRFKNEAHAAALLNHAHIVPIYSVGCDQGVHYYAMQIVQGRSLAAVIDGLRRPADSGKTATLTQGFSADKSIPTASLAPPEPAIAAAANASTARSGWKSDYFRRVAQLGIEAAQGLEHAHQLGVIHRDIKPANLLVDVPGNLWITDFGVALLKNHDAVTKTGELVGTLRYMSPEQAGAARPGRSSHGHLFPRRDPLRTGHAGPPIHEHRFRPASARDHLRRPPADARLDPSIPVDLEIIVQKAMAKSPAERYATAQDLADDLTDFWRISRSGRPGPSWSIGPSNGRAGTKGLVFAAMVTLLLTTITSLIASVLIGQSQRAATAAYQNEKKKASEAEQQRKRAEKSLARARQVVAFLTQVSADEMRDTPEFWPVRHKLLTGALQYYQEFIDEHHDDPTIRAELDAASGKVKEILTALTAQQESRN